MALGLPLQRRLVDGWPGLAGDLGDLLSLASPHDGTRLRALRLESDEITAQAMLWELADSPLIPDPTSLSGPSVAYRSMPTGAARIDIRWMQHALGMLGQQLPADGVLGPVTLRALERAIPAGLPLSPDARAELEYVLRPHPAAAGRRPLAVLLRPNASVEKLVSSHSDSGFDVADLYARFGFEVRTVRTLAETPVPTLLERGRPTGSSASPRRLTPSSRPASSGSSSRDTPLRAGVPA